MDPRKYRGRVDIIRSYGIRNCNLTETCPTGPGLTILQDYTLQKGFHILTECYLTHSDLTILQN